MLLSHTLMCSACSQDTPPAHLLQSPLTTVISSLLQRGLSGMLAGLTWIKSDAPGKGTLPYNATCSAVWAASDIGLAVGADLDVDLYQPFRHCHTSSSYPSARCPLIISAMDAAHCCLSPLSPATICCPMQHKACCGSFPCCCNIALLLMSAHVGAEIQELHGCVHLGGAMALT